MTKNQEDLRRKLLARIHTHEHYKEAAKMDAWSVLLTKLFKQESSKDLSIDELFILLDVLNRRDWHSQYKKRYYPRAGGASGALSTAGASHAQIVQISALSSSLEFSSADLFKYVKRQTKKSVLSLNALNAADAKAVIVGLRGIEKHRKDQDMQEIKAGDLRSLTPPVGVLSAALVGKPANNTFFKKETR
ncbi:MAG: phage protein GemA/Gp16 family protein [Helicobacteraceae bacterium]